MGTLLSTCSQPAAKRRSDEGVNATWYLFPAWTLTPAVSGMAQG